MGFTKLDSGILDSSIWSEPPATRVVWFTFLAKADENGYVRASRSGMFRAANVELEDFDRAMNCLEGPDPESRTPDYEGRRIQKVEGGWLVLNYPKYKTRLEIMREQTRSRVQNYRERLKQAENDRCNVTGNDAMLHCVTPALPSVSVSVSASEERGIGGKPRKRMITTHRECSEHLKRRILEIRQQKITEKTMIAWDRQVRLMIEQDSRTTADIHTLIDLCHNMEPSPTGFTWRNNILSMEKLRQRWNEGKIYIGMFVGSDEVQVPRQAGEPLRPRFGAREHIHNEQ
jgi:hypothetical protein